MAIPIPTAEDEDVQEPDANGLAEYAQIHSETNGTLADDNETTEINVNGNGHTEVGNRTVSNGALSQGRMVSLNGMDVHVYGNMQGLELLQFQGTDAEELHFPDSEEEAEEERQRAEAEIAIQQANQADAARRAAPLPPERCQAILDAMRGINLGGFRPDWADAVPEVQWMDRLRNTARTQGSDAVGSPGDL